MAHTRAFSVPISTGEKCSAAAFNQLDDGQYFALCRNGTSTLTANSTIDCDSFTMSFTDGVVKFEFTPEYTTTQDIGRVQPGAAVENSNFGFDATPNCYVQTAGGGRVTIPVTNLIDAASIKNVSVVLNGNSVYGSLPAVMPNIDLRKINSTTGADSSVVSATDTSATVGALNGVHTITTSNISEGIDMSSNAHHYYVVVYGSNGAGHANGLRLVSVKVTFSVTKITP